MTDRRRGLALGLAAATTFGAGTPFAKRLLEDTPAELLAGLLYLGAFMALLVGGSARPRRIEARLRPSDAPRLIGLVLTGGVLAPVAMLLGLDRVSAASGSLLLNLEGPFTLVVALLVFGEHLDRRTMLGASAIFGAAALLGLERSGGSDTVVGVALIALAGLLWAADNNLTQALTERDPMAIVLVKTGAASVVNVAVAVLVLGQSFPAAPVVAGALALGAVAYGLSTLLDAYALRLLGAAREAAVFATAPFVGLLLAIPVLGQWPTALELVAAVVMAGGLIVLLLERHVHLHEHRALVHDHVHVHDDHHQHAHPEWMASAEPHAHEHRHAPLVHVHAHVSDVHHRHTHG